MPAGINIHVLGADSRLCRKKPEMKHAHYALCDHINTQFNIRQASGMLLGKQIRFTDSVEPSLTVLSQSFLCVWESKLQNYQT
jgi:hypothetical protein